MGGSETWVKTMYDELAAQGHEVRLYVEVGINKAFPSIPNDDGGSYDLGILNHAGCLRALRKRDIGRIVFTSHGIIPGAEKPTDGADVYVAVSEEVQASMAEKGFESQVIRNPINLAKFNPKSAAPDGPNGVLFISNNPPKVVNRIARAVKGMKLPFYHYGGKLQVRDGQLISTMGRVSHVISLGRGCYEGMAMERNVIVMDYNGADGIVDLDSIYEFRKNNCSGRRYGLNWSEQDIQDAVNQYDPELGWKLRDYIRENNNVVEIAERYLCL